MFFIILYIFAVVSESSSSEVNILHVYSIDYVTTEPHEVLKKGVEWLNKNYLPTNTVFTTQSLVLNKVRGKKYNIIAISPCFIE